MTKPYFRTPLSHGEGQDALRLSRLQLDDAFTDGEDGGSGAVVDMKFMVNIPHMILHRFIADV